MKYISFPNEQAIQVYIETIFFDGIELGITRKELHTFLQENIAALAAEFWLTSKKEYLVTNYSSNQRNGYVDVVWTIGSSPLVAIEIDSSLREKSVKKLLASSANLLFWVYYGNRPFEPLINMLDLEGKVKVLHFPSKLWKYRVKPQDPEPIEKEKSKLISRSRYARIRKKYSNAYKKWLCEQDEQLKEDFRNGLLVREMANKLQRSTGAIRSRIKKLGLK